MLLKNYKFVNKIYKKNIYHEKTIFNYFSIRYVIFPCCLGLYILSTTKDRIYRSVHFLKLEKGGKFMAYIIIFGIVILILVFWIISVQRSFVAFDENINNAMSQIGVQLSSRWDALTSLLDLTKGYAAHEYETITETIKARRSITKDSSPDDVRQQENILVEAMGKIMAVAENYPVLKADSTYIKTMDAVNQYENMVRTSSG